MERLICVVIGYIFGLFQTAYIYGRVNHIDIREHGSGNAGTTNALRTLGKKAGLITFLGDCFKCVFAVLFVQFIYKERLPEMLPLLSMYAGMGVILGHNFPCYLKFKGGKGIAATAGLLLSTNLWMTLIALVVFVGTVAITRYVSLGSLIVVTLFVVQVAVYGQGGGFGMTQPHLFELYGITIFLMLLAYYKHRENIKRLLKGTENKLGSKK